MLNKLVKAVFLSFLLLLLSPPAFSLGLGELTLNSNLSQPFDARIDVVGMRPGDEDTLRIGIASVEDHRLKGMERSFIFSALKFTIVSDPDGGVVVALSSTQPINEPFLNFLVEVNWAQGRLLKEYTVFLDPPFVQPPRVGQSASFPASEKSDFKAVESNAQPRGSISGAGDSYGPVQMGDTLWNIVSDTLSQSGATRDQVMLAFVKANPHAFAQANANNLLAGMVLRIPNQEAIAEVDPGEASAEIEAQNRAWTKQRIEPRVASSNEGSQGRVERPVVNEESAKPEEGDVADQKAQDLLRLVRGEESKSVGAGNEGASSSGIAAKSRELLLLEEQLDSKQLENDELKERIVQLELQLATMQKMVNIIPSPAGEEVQVEGTEATEAEATEAEATEAEATEAEATEAETTEAEATEAETTEAEATEAEATEAEATEAETTEAETTEAETTEAETTEAETTEADKSILNTVVDWALENLIIVGSLVALLVLAVFLFLRRSKDEDEFGEFATAEADETHVANQDLDETAVSRGAEATDSIAEKDGALPAEDEVAADETDDFLKDFISPVSSVRSIDAEIEDVDPIAEADVYLTFNRHEQAAEILLDAIQYDPERVELKLKLLEVIYAQEKGEDFARIVTENETQLSLDSHWEQIKAMGFKLSPETSLFAGGDSFKGEFGGLVSSDEFEQDMLDLEDGSSEEDQGESSEFFDNLDFDEIEGEESNSDELTANLDLDDFSGEFDSTSVDLGAPGNELDVEGEEEVDGASFDDSATVMTKVSTDDAKDDGISLEFDSVVEDKESEEDKGVVLEFDQTTPKREGESFSETLIDEDASLEFSIDDPGPADSGEKEEGNNVEESGDSVLEFDAGSDFATDNAGVNKGLTLDLSTDSELSEEDVDGMSLEFDLSVLDEGIDSEKATASSGETGGTVLEIDEGGLEFDLDTDTNVVELEDDQEGLDATIISSIDSGIDLSVEFSETMPTLDAISSKLDLLAAYVEMGDQEAADTIAKEILEFGNEDQKQQAQKLLSQLD